MQAVRFRHLIIWIALVFATLGSLPGCGGSKANLEALCGPTPMDASLSFERNDVIESAVPAPDPRASSTYTALARTWPFGVIPYQVEAAIPAPERVTRAIAHWNARMAGIIRLTPRTSEPDWVAFARSPSSGVCASSVGRQGGRQTVLVGDSCGTGNLIHEIGHLVGLWHEQNRGDRDSHVVIRWENVIPGQAPQFALVGSWGKDEGAYDFSSIMHYPADAFSSNGLPTIETIPPGTAIGQRFALSAGDVAGVATLYKASAESALALAEVCGF